MLYNFSNLQMIDVKHNNQVLQFSNISLKNQILDILKETKNIPVVYIRLVGRFLTYKNQYDHNCVDFKIGKGQIELKENEEIELTRDQGNNQGRTIDSEICVLFDLNKKDKIFELETNIRNILLGILEFKKTDEYEYNIQGREHIHIKHGEYNLYNQKIIFNNVIEDCVNSMKKIVELVLKPQFYKVDLQRTDNYLIRPKQLECMNKLYTAFKLKKYKEACLHAKPRFGKCFTAANLISKLGDNITFIVSYYKDVLDEWAKTFNKHLNLSNFKCLYISDLSTEEIEDIINEKYLNQIVLLGTMQSLAERCNKNWINSIHFNTVIKDESHYGNDTKYGNEIFKSLKYDKILYVSATPFKDLQQQKFNEEQLASFTYSEEQKLKKQGVLEFQNAVELITFNIDLPDYIKNINNLEPNESFTFKKFFAIDTNNYGHTYFINETQVRELIGILFLEQNDYEKKKKYKHLSPFGIVNGSLGNKIKKENNNNCLDCTMWVLGEDNHCQELKNLLFSYDNIKKDFLIYKVSGENDEIDNINDLNKKIKYAHDIGKKVIILTCKKFTVGVTIERLQGIFMLNNIQSPEFYVQTVSRCLTPYTYENGEIKDKGFVFDFSPNRSLISIAGQHYLNDFTNNLNNNNSSNIEEKLLEWYDCAPVFTINEGLNWIQKEFDEIYTEVINQCNNSNSKKLSDFENCTININNLNFSIDEISNNLLGLNNKSNKIIHININQQIEKGKNLISGKEERLNNEDIKELKESNLLSEDNKLNEEKIKLFLKLIPLYLLISNNPLENSINSIILNANNVLFKDVTQLSINTFKKLLEIKVIDELSLNRIIKNFYITVNKKYKL